MIRVSRCFATGLLSAFLLLQGCNSTPSLEKQLLGTWAWHNGGSVIQWTFLSNHTYLGELVGDGGGPMPIGKWRIEGHDLVIEFRERTVAPAKTVSHLHIVTLEGDVLIANSGTMQLVYKRVK